MLGRERGLDARGDSQVHQHRRQAPVCRAATVVSLDGDVEALEERKGSKQGVVYGSVRLSVMVRTSRSEISVCKRALLLYNSLPS